MEYGLIGNPLGHSFSVGIHACLGDYDYKLCPMPPEALDAFFAARDFSGINVTIPYKQSVLRYLDSIDPHARAIGAVNTVVRDGKHLRGYNTDYIGLDAMIGRVGRSPAGRKVLILGTGGTARTAEAVFRDRGAAAVLRVSRTPTDGAVSYAEAVTRHADAAWLIQTTPVGMYPRIDRVPIGLDAFPNLEAVIDAVYHPLRTRLVLEARDRGIAAEGGLYMLVRQGVASASCFFGRAFPEETTDAVYKRILRERENAVLIGLPGSGKSTVGRLLADRLARPFFDTDALVAEKTGMTPDRLIRTFGEETFRAAEAEVVRELCPLTGCVIATGGGTVLREENRRALRQNGRLCFLDRDPSRLTVDDRHPLSPTLRALRVLAAARLPIYRAAADRVLPADGDPNTVAGLLAEDFLPPSADTFRM